LNHFVFDRARDSPEIMSRLSAQFDRELSPYDVLPPATALRWVASATLRGRLPVLRSFLRSARHNAAMARERRAVLEAR
jgi:hypothetical protein